MRQIIRQQIIFSGSVQGVGFRWRARHAAQLYGCTGRCRNEWDGTVVMEIQGTAQQIGQVMHCIEEGRYIRIEKTEITQLPVAEGERGFSTDQ